MATLQGLRLVEQEPSAPLLALCDLARTLLGVEAAAIGLVGAETVHLKGRLYAGVPTQIPRPVSFSTAVLEQDSLLVVEDASADPRFEPITPRPLFLAGHPIRAPNGHALGAFAVAGTRPRRMTEEQRLALERFALVAEALLVEQALGSVLAPDGRAPPDASAVLERATREPTRLMIALGHAAAPGAAMAGAAKWASYDPDLLRLVLRKHATEILSHLAQRGPTRFKDLLAAVPGLNQRTLSTRLEELRARGLITRTSYDEVPPRVEYDIAGDSRDLVRQLLQLAPPAFASEE